MKQLENMDENPISFIEDLEKLNRKINKNYNIMVDLNDTKYDLIYLVSDMFGYYLQEDQKQIWNLKWQDFYLNPEDLRKMLPFQKINRFPGSYLLCKKNNLCKHLKHLQKEFPEDYNFFPQTWQLPQEIDEVRKYIMNKNNLEKSFIAKPESNCQGKGIYLFQNINKLQYQQQMIVQEYIQNPFLIDQLKFDIRLYVLIKNINPLKIFLYKEGIARFATQEFQKPNSQNLNNHFIHLTNYAINKKSPIFQQNFIEDNTEKGHKRTFSSIIEYLKQQGHNTQKILMQIEELVIKTISTVQPIMTHQYKINRPVNEQQECCFEILGFDILLDSKLKPWLLEVNHSPSFSTDSNMDFLIKKNLILDTFILLNLNYQDKKNKFKSNIAKIYDGVDQQKQNLILEFENNNLNGYQRIFPNEQFCNEKFLSWAKKYWINTLSRKRTSQLLIHQPSQKLNNEEQSSNRKLSMEQKFKNKSLRFLNEDLQYLQKQKEINDFLMSYIIDKKNLKNLNKELLDKSLSEKIKKFRQKKENKEEYTNLNIVIQFKKKQTQNQNIRIQTAVSQQRFSRSIDSIILKQNQNKKNQDQCITREQQINMNQEKKLRFKKSQINNLKKEFLIGKQQQQYQNKQFLLIGQKFQTSETIQL